MTLRLTVAAVIVFTLTGCAGQPLSPEAASIQVHNQMSTLLDNCKNLGPVTGTGNVTFVHRPIAAAADAKGALRQAAFDKGGDTVAITNFDGPTLANGGTATVQGVAMKCY